MKLKRLHLQGFKSFRDRTTIHFDEGITGIVGPNGCGKSNIVDALFWVMGEQSAKHLRGKKMSDLIFAGSNKYKPATWAEVSLVLENDTEKHIHIGNKVVCPSEIQLTRKLYRNNETEYRINNEPCRLKDIHEVFMDTGAGAKSYSIIAQGEINRLVQAKPSERRVMIEEVAGITKFKLRKRESEKKLDKTQENLSRLEDLRIEVHKQLKNLERQSEKANRAKSLRERIKRHELISESHREHDFLMQFVEGDGKISLHEKIMEEASSKKELLDAQLDELSLKKEEHDEKIELKQSEYNDRNKELAQAQERVSSLTNLIAQKEERILSLEEDVKESLELKEEKETKRKNLSESYSSFCENRVSEDSIAIIEEKLGVAKTAYDITRLSLQEKEQNKTSLNESLNSLKHEKEKAEYSLNELSFQLENIAENLEELEGSYTQMNDQVHSLKQQKESITKNLSEAQDGFDSENQSLERAKDEFIKTQDELKSITSQFIKLESKKEALENLEKEFNSNLSGAQNFLGKYSEGHSILSELMDVPVEYSRHTEVLFTEVLNTLCSNSNDITSFSNWLSDSNELTQFYKAIDGEDLSEEGIERLSLLGIGEITSLKNIVALKNEEYQDFYNKLLSGYYIVEKIEAELLGRLESFPSLQGLIQRDGKSIVKREGNGFSYRRLDPNSELLGPLQRRSLLKQVRIDLSQLKEVQEGLDLHFIEKQNEVESLQKSREESLINLSELKASLNGVESEIRLKEQVFSDYARKRDKIITRKDEISNQRLGLIEKQEQGIEDESQLSLSITEIIELISTLKIEDESLSKSFEELNVEYQGAKAQFDSFSSQRSQFETQIEDLDNEINRYEQKVMEGKEKFETFTESLIQLKEDEVDIAKKLEGLTEIVSEIETDLQGTKEEAVEVYRAFKDLESQLKQAALDYNNSEKSIIKFRANIERIIEEEELLVRNLFERYQVDLRSCLKSFLEIEDEKLSGLGNLTTMHEEGDQSILYSFEKRFPAQVRESKEKFKRYKKELARLGEVNWQAVDDFERQKKRHDFLQDQKEELQKSVDDLMQAIYHIDEKSKLRFKEAYEEVNSRFVKVFPIIFGGGNAHLKLIGSLEDPDCGIDIIAQPPGKKMQNINLMSGGEKAMTAVSLIFSIFLVKPSPFCLLDEVDAPLDDANVGRFNELLREMSDESQFILITHNKKTMEMNDILYGVTMQEPGVSKAVSVQLH